MQSNFSSWTFFEDYFEYVFDDDQGFQCDDSNKYFLD